MRRALIISMSLALVLAACGGGTTDGPTATEPPVATPSGDAAVGESLFKASCSACHGLDAMGIDGLGKAIPGSEFIAANSEDDLVAFLKIGRSVSDPENTTGVDMPPKGGNPALDDTDLLDIVTYLKSLQP
jgi:mono/diheme cytochrome c family protein